VFRNEQGEISKSAIKLAGNRREIDAVALQSVLQFGVMVPPLAPYKGVTRLTPVDSYSAEDFKKWKEKPITKKSQKNIEKDLQRLIELLDNQLKTIERPIVLFSGGIDSGLIAARLAALKKSETLLVHFSFGKKDPETRVAIKMASYLGLRIECVEAFEKGLLRCLECPGRIFPLPFADESTAPMTVLANHLISREDTKNATIIDGTGADGVFGLGNKTYKWSKLFLIPKELRKILALPYSLGFWKRPGETEYLCRLLRRSCDLPPWAAFIAQNALNKILYRQEESGKLLEVLNNWISERSGEQLNQRIYLADVGLTCANIFAQKALSIFRDAGKSVCFPFLNSNVVQLGIELLKEEEKKEPKTLLKTALKRQIPEVLLNRKKTGFTDPQKKIFYSSVFFNLISEAASESSPLRPFLLPKNLLILRDMLAKGQKIPQQTLNCIWAIVFTDRWYRTAEDREYL